MDTNFIIFFIFLIIILEYITYINDGMQHLIFGMFMAAIFANTQSASPLFFANSDYLGFGRLFNTFWLILAFICFVQSYTIAKDQGIFKRFT